MLQDAISNGTFDFFSASLALPNTSTVDFISHNIPVSLLSIIEQILT